MAENTEISWCDHTFNPWIGCTKVSPGCDNCYAAAQDKFRSWTPEGWGAGKPRKRTSASTWAKPLQWNGVSFFKCLTCHWRGEFKNLVQGVMRSTCPVCSSTVNIARRRVFCASLADVFDNEVDPQWRRDLFWLISETPNLDWLVLTKRIGNVMPMMRAIIDIRDPLPANVWLGATIVNQEEADRDIPKLLATPAAVRFLSMEPLLGPVALSRHLLKCCGDFLPGAPGDGWMQPPDGPQCCNSPEPTDLHWVIVGGESGPGARPMHPDWARSLRDQCASAGVPFHFKQWGEWLPTESSLADEVFADDGTDRELQGRVTVMNAHQREFAKVGKKAAGRLLDGVTHDAFPEVR